jgi:hypothetical protein
MDTAGMAYIVRSENGALAGCAADANEAILRRFLRKHGKRKCDLVPIAEARELLIAHRNHKLYGTPIPDRPADGEFRSMATWINKATSWIGGENALCVDAKDRICRCGGDFQRANDEGAFPVRFYYGAGGETEAEQRKAWTRAKKALKRQYPWRDYR